MQVVRGLFGLATLKGGPFLPVGGGKLAPSKHGATLRRVDTIAPEVSHDATPELTHTSHNITNRTKNNTSKHTWGSVSAPAAMVRDGRTREMNPTAAACRWS